MASQEVFERNLRALRKRCRWLIPELERSTRESIETVTGPRGAEVLSDRGVLLGSSYDPDREAQRLADQMASEPADILISIGFGLGQHFELFRKDHSATLIVFEPSMARLRAGLERTPIHGLLERHKNVYFSQDLENLATLIENVYVPGLRVRVVPHPAVLRLDESVVKRTVERIRRVKEAADTKGATSVEKLIPWSRIVAENGQRIVRCPCFGQLRNAFEGKTVVVVAAGPSLDQQIETLAEYQDRVVIIAIGQTAKALSLAGIRPDLVHILESRNVSHQLTDPAVERDLDVVLFPDCHPALFDVPTRSTFVATSPLSPMGNWISAMRGDDYFVLGGGTVAQGAVGLAESLGAKRILLIGQDLALSEGRVYAKNSAYDFVGYTVDEAGRLSWSEQKAKVALLGDRDVSQTIDNHDGGEIVWVDGWYEGKRVMTWRSYASFIEQYREIGAYLDSQGVELVNCTEGGARIPGLRHAPFRRMLEESGAEPCDAAAVIAAAAQAHQPLTLEHFRVPLVEARAALDGVLREAKKGARLGEQFARGIESGREPEACVRLLRGLAKQEKRIKNLLRRMSWFDTLVQPEIYASMASNRRVDRQDPSMEEIVFDSRALFEAAQRGCERARSWFEEFEASFERPPATEASTSAAHSLPEGNRNWETKPSQPKEESPSSRAPAAESVAASPSDSLARGIG